jgi:uncharacterized protein
VTRIILDTNIWVMFLISKDYSKLDRLLISGQATLIFSEELLVEFLEVASRPKFKKYFKKSDVDAILDTIDDVAQFVKVLSKTNVCRDPKDNFLLSLAKDGNAEILITGDYDLLQLKKFGKTKIMTIADYLSRE